MSFRMIRRAPILAALLVLLLAPAARPATDST
jgi:hypothetical protein